MGSRALDTEAMAPTGMRLPDVRSFLRWLKPLDGGPHEIRALDGLRAIAALSVLLYHVYDTQPQAYGPTIGKWWYIPFAGQTGVDLFFVLSGFLLFLPFARAILTGRSLPDTRRFFSRRALRILPAYLACMAIMVAVQWSQYGNAAGALDVGAHLLFLHDMFPPFNNAIDGVFWTLALEGQFYLMLPFVSALFRRVVGPSRSATRLALCIGGFILMALAMRQVGAIAGSVLAHPNGQYHTIALVGTLLLCGVQGKFFEVFGLGMLCALVYILVKERAVVSRRVSMLLGSALFVAGVVGLVIIARDFGTFTLRPLTGYTYLRGGNVRDVLTPLFLGLAYAGVLLGVLLGARIIRAPFEFGPLCFLGIISYSIYLWHAPAIWAQLPFTGAIPIWWRAGLGIVLAYLSYTFVEKPFLQRRRAAAAKPAPAQAEVGLASVVR